MNSNHTPSPWKHDPTWGLIMHGKQEICALHSGIEANAKLIASAPELLEALKELLSMSTELLPLAPQGCGWGQIALDNARAVIAKATAA
jgi:hypothetical protein